MPWANQTKEKNAVLKIVNLINGHFRTPKINQLHLLIDWLNNKHNINIAKLPIDNSPLNQNGWLTGFIESDGCFFIGYSLVRPRYATKLHALGKPNQRKTNYL